MFSMAQWLKPGNPDVANLGHLERELMEHVWELNEASVSDVQEGISGRLAYTTIMTTLDRLFKKGILARRKEGRAFLYSARFTREEFKQNLVRKALDFLIAEHHDETMPLMAHLVETFKQHDARLLDELEKMIQQSRSRTANRKTQG
jgi:predicted transcriptional regulator